MERKIHRFVAFLFFLTSLYTANHLFAQWEPDIRLSFTDTLSQTSMNNARCVATGSGGLVHAVWWGWSGAVWYARSIDGGVSWSQDGAIATSQGSSLPSPSIAALNMNVYVVYSDSNSIFFLRSTDGGLSWDTPLHLSKGVRPADNPSICADGTNLYAVWHVDLGSNYYNVHFRRSTDSGLSWSDTVNLSGLHYTQLTYPSVSASGSMVHVVWDGKPDGASVNAVFYRRSTNGGVSWLPDTMLSDTFSIEPSIFSTDSIVNVVLTAARGGSIRQVYHLRSINSGASWSIATRLSNGLPDAPSVSSSSSNIHVVWSNTSEIHYRHSTNLGAIWSQDTVLAQNSQGTSTPSVNISGSVVHIIWQDLRRYPKRDVFYKRNPTGNIGVEENSEVMGQGLGVRITAKPNPFTSFASVPGHETERFSLYDISGRKVGTYKGDRIGEGLSAGVYFLRKQEMLKQVQHDEIVRIVKVR